MSSEQDKQKWPFDPLQHDDRESVDRAGDHEPIRIPDDHPAKEPRRPEPKPEP
jgi:hypothetical protein